MRPQALKTKIFLDSGDPAETREAIKLLGFLDGQTTNPTYFAKSSEVRERLQKFGKFTREELYSFYREAIESIYRLIPSGSISIEVYADKNTTAEEMLKKAREMYKWVPNAHIKFPIIAEGMKAAEKALLEGMRINMTLCFSQEQAAAVYALTKGAKKGQVYVSPFMGRHIDSGRDGVALVKNIIRMYKQGDRYVEVLAASLRGLNQFYAVIQEGTDIITAGLKYLEQWHSQNLIIPGSDFVYDPEELEPIDYQELDLERPWTEFHLEHEMTNKGLEQFASDWNALIKT